MQLANADMKKIIRAGIETGKKVLWVGTAAMADNLLEIEKKETHPVLSVLASLSSANKNAGKIC